MVVSQLEIREKSGVGGGFDQGTSRVLSKSLGKIIIHQRWILAVIVYKDFAHMIKLFLL